MGNKSSNGIKSKGAEHSFNAVRKQPISDEFDAILPSASKQQRTLPKISLVNSITSETLFAGNGSVEEDVSSYKDAENELPLVSECSDSVNAPDLPLDSNTLDSFCRKILPGDETTCSLSSDLDELTSECPSNGDTWTDFFARTNEIDLQEIKLLKNRPAKNQVPKLQSKEKLNNGQLDYLALDVATLRKCQGFSNLYNNRSLSTTVIEVNLSSHLKPLSNSLLTFKKQENIKDNLEMMGNFKGHELVSNLIASIDDDHYLKFLISQSDLNQLMNHVAGYLLGIGLLVPKSREKDKFMVEETYSWVQGQYQGAGGIVSMEEHLMAIKDSKERNDFEMCQLKAEYSQRIKDLEVVIANLSKEIRCLKANNGIG